MQNRKKMEGKKHLQDDQSASTRLRYAMSIEHVAAVGRQPSQCCPNGVELVKPRGSPDELKLCNGHSRTNRAQRCFSWTALANTLQILRHVIL